MISNDSDIALQQRHDIKSCRLVHHGAAAAVSGNQIVTWIPAPHVDDVESSSLFVYASNAILNITDTTTVLNIGNSNHEKIDDVEHIISQPSPTRIRHVHETLRCTAIEGNEAVPQQQHLQQPQISPVVISCVVAAKDTTSSLSCDLSSMTTALVTGFSNGMIQVWRRQENRWTEHTIIATTGNSDENQQQSRSITAIDAIWLSSSSKEGNMTLQIAAGTSAGMTWYECTFDNNNNNIHVEVGVLTTTTRLSTKACGAVASLQYTFITLPRHQQEELQQQQQQYSKTIVLLFIGTAAPRNNKIHVYQCYNTNPDRISTAAASNVASVVEMDAIQYCGFLTGHEDWVTTLASVTNRNDELNNQNQNNSTPSSNFLLASGSQDARIRIWKFRTTSTITATTPIVDPRDYDQIHIKSQNDTHLQTETELNVQCSHNKNNIVSEPENDLLVEDNDGIPDDEFYDDIGESRLEIVHRSPCQQQQSGDPNNQMQTTTAIAITTVTLEALLCGHEEGVTCVVWHPDPTSLYGSSIDQLLISSSTDRTILLWSETPTTTTTTTTDDRTMIATTNYGGIWTPLSRVGSAGGILGGSIGSSLLGFCGVSVEPIHGRTLVGHAYGGALHIWDTPTTDVRRMTEEECSVVQWKASPCITGHFAGVTDCCWEATNGDYLLTVSNDQTCRLWAQLKTNLVVGSSTSKNVWVEMARPQVHGYNLSAVASLSTRHHPHLIVTGADEKEIRAFDAPKTTLRLLDTFADVTAVQSDDVIHSERVERAYIPSLGLSNKASPADAAAEDDDNENESETASAHHSLRLPLERDLGAVSLWPEVQKLFGHNTEIYCLTASIMSCDFDDDLVIVASSSKARDADDAKIRLWSVQSGQCLQVLSGGHRSTVAAMSFSSNGKYLASSGKDRRLCLWKKHLPSDSSVHEIPTFQLSWALDSAHKRIVWSVHFCPFESQMLASASRDGCIKIWSIQEVESNTEGSTTVTEMINYSPTFQRSGKPDAVTAISFAPIPLSNHAVLAVGLESGRIELWCIPYTMSKSGLVSNGGPYPLSGLHPLICHCETITNLTWRPIRSGVNSEEKMTNIKNEKMTTVLVLASCSMDQGCRVFEIEFP